MYRYRTMYKNRRDRRRLKINRKKTFISYKQQIINLLIEHHMFDTFPKWLLNNSKEVKILIQSYLQKVKVKRNGMGWYIVPELVM